MKLFLVDLDPDRQNCFNEQFCSAFDKSIFQKDMKCYPRPGKSCKLSSSGKCTAMKRPPNSLNFENGTDRKNIFRLVTKIFGMKLAARFFGRNDNIFLSTQQ